MPFRGLALEGIGLEGIGLLAPLIDLHCHLLPGIDDGPPTTEDSLALALAAARAGTRTLVATSHVSWEYPNRADTIARLVDELNRRLRGSGVALEILPGAEIAMTRVADIAPGELSRLTLGRGKWLLVEPPFTPVLAGLDLVTAGLQRRGYQVLLAHPERCPAFHRDRPMLERLVSSGVLTSVTAGSLDGRFGRAVRDFSLGLVRDTLIHNVASDAHDQVRRPPTVVGELERAGLGPLTDWLTQAVPAAILSGSEIPPRPDIEIEIPARRPRWLPGRR
jgi:protein-tyrosine phosphatase